MERPQAFGPLVSGVLGAGAGWNSTFTVNDATDVPAASPVEQVEVSRIAV